MRQFVVVNLLLPALFGAFWFWAFGGASIYFDWKGCG
ncbi:hypothetical protein DXT76_19990 [Halobacillus trueperi]|uniref:Uncharacterized protein n=1 Tax=Halobacillus trueperi TaxID=156205 RepID=A0A3D8VBY6_9BACI|nr:hypothetical protein DXT76_19990 [Halobacillus trueperi]